MKINNYTAGQRGKEKRNDEILRILTPRGGIPPRDFRLFSRKHDLTN